MGNVVGVIGAGLRRPAFVILIVLVFGSGPIHDIGDGPWGWIIKTTARMDEVRAEGFMPKSFKGMRPLDEVRIYAEADQVEITVCEAVVVSEWGHQVELEVLEYTITTVTRPNMSPFAVLGIQQDNLTNEQHVKLAYLAKARMLHPDTSDGDTAKMARINDARDKCLTLLGMKMVA